MTQKKIILRPVGSAVNRRIQPFLQPSRLSSRATGVRLAEMAGGTTAECAAVWCCCPCTLVNLIVLVVYKVPAGICKKALRMRRRRKMIKKGLLPLPSFAASSTASPCGCSSQYEEMESITEEGTVVVKGRSAGSDGNIVIDKDLMQLEEEMWERFYTTGFWRSPSQKEK